MLKQFNHFDTFNLKPSFDINLANLKATYHSLSKIHHPDISNDDKFIQIKKAYDILKNDYKRAFYLYKLNDKKLENNVDSKFLNKILQLEENIENKSNLKETYHEILKRIDDCKMNYANSKYLNQWRYYERLKEHIEKIYENK
ncbi:hypothetical protein GVAV_002345 [Gurleya vavrai]